MSKVRTFRWPSGDGFDVVDGNIFYFENGKRTRQTVDWSVAELEEYVSDPTDPLTENTPKNLAQVHNTRVFLVKGEVVDVEDARALYDALREALNEWDGEDNNW